MNINEFLEKWKSESLFGERQFKKLDSSLVASQSLYLLSYKAEVSVDGAKKSIQKNNFFKPKFKG